MKRTQIGVLASLAVAVALVAFTFRQSNSIKGTVTPGDKAVKAVAILADSRDSKDSVSATVSNGSFEIPNLKAGDYNVVIVAQEPYGNVLKAGITVHSGQTTEVGNIQLQEK